MKIAIDARIIFKRGVGRYIANLVKNILDIDKTNTYYIYLDRNSTLNDYFGAKNCFFKRLDVTNALFYEQYCLPRAASEDGADILHGTDNTLPYMLPLFKGKTVVTIHDTMFIRPLGKAVAKPTVKQRLTDVYNKSAIPASAKEADAVITVSEYSKQDIIKNIKIGDEKITVIPEGVEKKYRVINNTKAVDKVKAKYGITKPYILISAASDTRKNAVRALEAFNIFNNMTEYKYQLVMTSIGEKELATTVLAEKIAGYNLEKYVVITGYVPDDEMVLLYNGAKFFLFPSIWEGFGLQVLEAFACGLPVLTSGTTSLKELAGDAADFIDPFSVEDIVKGMAGLEKNEDRRRTLAEKGLKQAEKFSWKDTAKETLKVYEGVFSGAAKK